jgi:phosphoglycolate phosphatase
MKYSTVIFDLDGTLTNTLEDLHDSTIFALQNLGYPLHNIEKTRQSVGNGNENLIARLLPGGRENPNFDKALNLFKEHYGKNSKNKTRPYEGIESLLKELKSQNFKLAVISNKFDWAVKDIVDYFFPNVFDISVGESESIKRKPCPDALFKVVNDLGEDLNNVVFVGDSDVDIMTAKNAGVDVISVSWGFRTRDELLKAGAETIIDNPDELLKYVL